MLDWAVLTFVTLPIPELVADLVSLATLAAFSRASTPSITSVAFSTRIAPLSGRSGLGSIRALFVFLYNPLSDWT